MRRLFDEMMSRPLCALFSTMGMFGAEVGSAQRIDAMVSRFTHALSGPSPRGCDDRGGATSSMSMGSHTNNKVAPDVGGDSGRDAGFTDEDCLILDRVEGALADGRALKRWWDRAYPNGFAERFELERVFNRPDSSFGFFDHVRLDSGVLPVMGNFQDMLYDQPRTPARLTQDAAAW